MITTSMLCSGYDKKQILFDVDFTAGDELTVIVGSNGSGKSTLLKSVFGLCNIYSGSISLDGQDITNIPTHKITDLGISYMPQINNVFSDLTITENLILGDIHKKPNLKYLFNFFPILESYQNKKAKNLSGGERQLLAMAMALAKNPKVILFDEPTANLSPKNSIIVLEKIKEIQAELKNCVIMVEQNVKHALNLCDQCYLFSSGNIIYNGNPQDLLNDKDLAQKYLGVKRDNTS